jgi:hypothetical protein
MLVTPDTQEVQVGGLRSEKQTKKSKRIEACLLGKLEGLSSSTVERKGKGKGKKRKKKKRTEN